MSGFNGDAFSAIEGQYQPTFVMTIDGIAIFAAYDVHEPTQWITGFMEKSEPRKVLSRQYHGTDKTEAYNRVREWIVMAMDKPFKNCRG